MYLGPPCPSGEEISSLIHNFSRIKYSSLYFKVWQPDYHLRSQGVEIFRDPSSWTELFLINSMKELSGDFFSAFGRTWLSELKIQISGWQIPAAPIIDFFSLVTIFFIWAQFGL